MMEVVWICFNTFVMSCIIPAHHQPPLLILPMIGIVAFIDIRVFTYIKLRIINQ